MRSGLHEHWGWPKLCGDERRSGPPAGTRGDGARSGLISALVYFPVCNALGRNVGDVEWGEDKPAGRAQVEEKAVVAAPEGGEGDASAAEAATAAAEEERESRIGKQSTALALALSIVAVSRAVAPTGYDMPLATLLTVRDSSWTRDVTINQSE